MISGNDPLAALKIPDSGPSLEQPQSSLNLRADGSSSLRCASRVSWDGCVEANSGSTSWGKKKSRERLRFSQMKEER